MKYFQELYDAGQVKRWHTWPTHKVQTLADHSWGVALTIMAIRPEMDSPNLLKAALVHDLHEVEAGDIPYPFKKDHPHIKNEYAIQEYAFNSEREINFKLDPYDLKCLKWADMFELYMFARQEFEMGNSKMERTMQVALDALLEMGMPNANARNLFMERTAIYVSE